MQSLGSRLYQGIFREANCDMKVNLFYFSLQTVTNLISWVSHIMNVRLKIQDSYHVEENQRHHKILMNPQTVALKRAKQTHNKKLAKYKYINCNTSKRKLPMKSEALQAKWEIGKHLAQQWTSYWISWMCSAKLFH